MQAIILAAGRGSRLGTMTENQPKPLAKLAGKPLIEWQLASLAAAGVDDVHVVCGYCSEALQDYGNNRIMNVNWASSNMVRSLMCADAVLSEVPTLVCYTLPSNDMIKTYHLLFLMERIRRMRYIFSEMNSSYTKCVVPSR